MKIENDTKYLAVPSYIAESFGLNLSNEDKSSKRVQSMRGRIHKLIANALEDLPHADWEIMGTDYKSKFVVEPAGMQNDGVMIYIYGKERGNRTPIAIFKDSHMAAEYFVWLASKGERKINWELFLNMEL